MRNLHVNTMNNSPSNVLRIDAEFQSYCKKYLKSRRDNLSVMEEDQACAIDRQEGTSSDDFGDIFFHKIFVEVLLRALSLFQKFYFTYLPTYFFTDRYFSDNADSPKNFISGLNRNFESEPNHLPMGVCIDNLTKVRYRHRYDVQTFNSCTS